MSSSRCSVNTQSRPAQPQLIGSLRSALCALCVLLWQSALADVHYVDVTSTNLGPTATWVTNSAAPVVIGGQDTVTNLITGPQQFYRLIQ